MQLFMEKSLCISNSVKLFVVFKKQIQKKVKNTTVNIKTYFIFSVMLLEEGQIFKSSCCERGVSFTEQVRRAISMHDFAWLFH